MSLIEEKIKSKLPFEIQNIISEYWCWKKYYTNNVLYHINHFNYDLSINHFIINVFGNNNSIDSLDSSILSQKSLHYYFKSYNYFRNNKKYIYNLNKKIKYIIENKELFDFYKKKCEWMYVINTSYYNNTYIIEEIKYYSYMILYYTKLNRIKIYYSLRDSFLHDKPINSFDDINYLYLIKLMM